MKTLKNLLPLLLIGVLFACEKKPTPPPPVPDVVLPVSHTIAQFKEDFTPVTIGAVEAIVKDSVIICGVVTSTDESGNVYKYVTIQDSTAAIKINMGKTNIYNDFPLGQKVYIKCTGMHIGAYGEMLQIGNLYMKPGGNPQVGQMTEDEIKEHVIRSGAPNPANIPAPKEIFSFTDLNDADLCKLVILKNVRFETPGYFFAENNDSSSVESTQRKLFFNPDQIGGNIVTYTSEYARFSKEIIPSGRGEVVGILTRYFQTWQMIIREKNDYYQRGGFQDTAYVDPYEKFSKASNMSIKDLKDLYYANPQNGPVPPSCNDKKITGIVISDRVGNNSVSGKAIYVQEQGADGRGINLFLTANHKFNEGDKVEILLQGSSFELYANTLELTGTALSSMRKIGTGTITPTVLTVTELTANMQKYQSTLVTIRNATIKGANGSTTFQPKSNNDLTDATGTMTLRIATTADFAPEIVGQTIPTGTVHVSGIASPFNTSTQIAIRNMGDIFK